MTQGRIVLPHDHSLLHEAECRIRHARNARKGTDRNALKVTSHASLVLILVFRKDGKLHPSEIVIWQCTSLLLSLFQSQDDTASSCKYFLWMH